MTSRLPIPRDDIARICRRHGIRRLALFGSVLRDEFSPSSDVDVLIDFEPGRSPSLFRLQDIEDELSNCLGKRRLDLTSPHLLPARIRDRVLAEAETFYGEG